MRLISIDPSRDERWDRLVLSHPLATIYHTSSWQKVIGKSLGFRQAHLGLHRPETNELAGIIPGFWVSPLPFRKKFISLPLTSYCDPLLPESFDEDRLIALMQLHFKGNPSLIKCRKKSPLLDKMFTRSEDFVIHNLDISTDSATIYQRCHVTTIRQRIQKAMRNDIKTRFDGSKDSLAIFYGYYLQNRKNNGLPPAPYSFFKNILRTFGPKGEALIALTEHEGVTVGAALLLLFRDTCHYEFGTTDERFKQMGAGTLMIWDSIMRAIQEGKTRFDFGRSSSTHTSLTEYKARWGAEPHPLYYYSSQKPEIEQNNRTRPIAEKINRKLPLALLRLEGEILYRRYG